MQGIPNPSSLDPFRRLGKARWFRSEGWNVSVEIIKQAKYFSAAGIP